MEDSGPRTGKSPAPLRSVHPYRECVINNVSGNLLAGMGRTEIVRVLPPDTRDDRTFRAWSGSLLDRFKDVWQTLDPTS